MSRQTVLLSYTQWKASLKHCSKYFHLPRTKLKSYSQAFWRFQSFPAIHHSYLFLSSLGSLLLVPTERARARERESWVSWRVGERTWERGWKEMRMDGTSCTVNHDLISKLTFQPTKNPVEEVLWRLLEISGFPYHLSHPFLLSKNEMMIDGNSCAVSGDLGLWRRFALKLKPSILRWGFWK